MNKNPGASNLQLVSGFFRLLDIDIADVGSQQDAMERLLAGDINGVIVRNIYDQDLLSLLVERLEMHDPPFLKTWFPEEFKSWFYGRNLNLADPGLHGYFEESHRFHEQLDLLFPPEYGITTHIAGLLSVLAGGRRFLAAPGPGLSQHYMFTTIRCHLQGGFIPPHIDYEYMRRRSYQHLRTIIGTRIISFVIALTVPERGGTLDVFDFRADNSDTVPSASVTQDHAIDGLKYFSVPFTPGSIFIFDSGRYLHALSPVSGNRNRWTICSFMAAAIESNDFYCWG